PQDFDTLAGSSGNSLIRVFASDGMNSGVAVSAPFSVPKKLPQAEITFPANGTEYQHANMVWLQSAALDFDDGALPDSAYRWISSEDGFLGNGHDLPLTSLSLGTHVITLTVTDSDGNQATDSISINVVDRPLVEPGADPATVQFAAPSFTVNEQAGF